MENEEKSVSLTLDMAPLESLAKGNTLTVPRSPNFSRKDVVNAINQAFELIGGVPRLAIWANENPDKFYAMWGKQVPTGMAALQGTDGRIRLEMAIAPSPLDHTPVDAPYYQENTDHASLPVPPPAAEGDSSQHSTPGEDSPQEGAED